MKDKRKPMQKIYDEMGISYYGNLDRDNLKEFTETQKRKINKGENAE